jgi:B12-binding domain/radical SAM domain protein
VVGEGEFALKEILTYIAEEENPDPRNFAYPCVFVSEKKPQESGKKTVDLNTYPPFSETFRIFGPIEITRGCPYACKYCQTGSMYRKVRHADIDSIVMWLKRVSEIKFDKCWFLSPNALSYGTQNNKPSPEILESLLSQIHEIKALKEIYFGTFPSEVRPEFVTDDVLKVIRPHITNDYFVVGAQAVTNSLLKKIGRTHTVEDIYLCITNMEKYKMTAEIDLIFGLPGETEEDILSTIEFLVDVETKFRNVRVRGHTFMPLPGTEFEFEPTGIIDERIIKQMGRLTNMKKARGEYFEQAKFNS